MLKIDNEFLSNSDWAAHSSKVALVHPLSNWAIDAIFYVLTVGCKMAI